MNATQSPASDPDFTLGIPLDQLADGQMLAGHVGEDAVLLARRGDDYFAIGATCSHYGGPLAEGLMVGDTVRCPWHHACFSLRTGEALGAPAFNPVPCWRIEESDGKVIVRERSSTPPRARLHGSAARDRQADRSSSWVAAPRDLPPPRCCGGKDTPAASRCSSADDAAPYDRPNCSKDYLAGMRAGRLDAAAAARILSGAVDRASARRRGDCNRRRARQVALANGRSVPFDRLLLATGAEPVRLDVPGADRPHVHCCARSPMPRHHRQRADGAARRCHRRELHRA